MLKNSLIIFIITLIFSGLIYTYRSGFFNGIQENLSQKKSPEISINWEKWEKWEKSEKTVQEPQNKLTRGDMSYQDALDFWLPIEELAFRVFNTEEDRVFFDDMYIKFKELQSYKDFKKYIQTFPELLPVIYAVKFGDKEEYLKFYGFIFDRVFEEGKYVDDIIAQVGEWTPEEMKSRFLDVLGDHYEKIVSWSFSFTKDFWDGPIHIALTNDSMDDVKKNCDESAISGENDSTKAECYDYAYQYRATEENKLCEKVQSFYQQRVCFGFLEHQNYSY